MAFDSQVVPTYFDLGVTWYKGICPRFESQEHDLIF